MVIGRDQMNGNAAGEATVDVAVQAIPLSQLPRGARATLHRHDLHCDDCELLNAMGMTERCKLRVCRMGNPCIVQVKSTRLGLSSSMARNIMVFPERSTG